MAKTVAAIINNIIEDTCVLDSEIVETGDKEEPAPITDAELATGSIAKSVVTHVVWTIAHSGSEVCLAAHLIEKFCVSRDGNILTEYSVGGAIPESEGPLRIPPARLLHYPVTKRNDGWREWVYRQDATWVDEHLPEAIPVDSVGEIETAHDVLQYLRGEHRVNESTGQNLSEEALTDEVQSLLAHLNWIYRQGEAIDHADSMRDFNERLRAIAQALAEAKS